MMENEEDTFSYLEDVVTGLFRMNKLRTEKINRMKTVIAIDVMRRSSHVGDLSMVISPYVRANGQTSMPCRCPKFTFQAISFYFRSSINFVSDRSVARQDLTGADIGINSAKAFP
jgi:hypothetical protein